MEQMVKHICTITEVLLIVNVTVGGHYKVQDCYFPVNSSNSVIRIPKTLNSKTLVN